MRYLLQITAGFEAEAGLTVSTSVFSTQILSPGSSECVVLARADRLVLVVLPFFWMVYFLVLSHLFSTLTCTFEAAIAAEDNAVATAATNVGTVFICIEVLRR